MRKEEKIKREKRENRKANLSMLLDRENQTPWNAHQVYMLKTDIIWILGKTVKEVVDRANADIDYKSNSKADRKSHEAAKKLGLTKGFPTGRSLTIARLPDKRALKATHDKAKIYWNHNLPSAIGARTILTLTDMAGKTTYVPTSTRNDKHSGNRSLRVQERIFGSYIRTNSRYTTTIETTQTTKVRVEKGMILTELGGWVLIDKHENENSRISMAILSSGPSIFIRSETTTTAYVYI
jgi:hypothetical protein